MEKTAFSIYLIVLVVSPILFGAVEPYAYTLMILGVLAGTCAWLFHEAGQSCLSIPRTPLNFLFLVLLIYLFFQITHLPDAFIKWISPETTRIYDLSSQAIDVLDANKESRAWLSIAPYRYPVRLSIIRWITYGLLFFGMVQVLNSKKRIEAAVFVILAIGCFEVLYGLFEGFSGHGRVLWAKKLAGPRSISGTYINRNHFGGLMTMGMLLAVSYSAALTGNRKRRKSRFGAKTGFRLRISRYLSDEKRISKRALAFFAGVVMGVGLVLSASRGAIVSGAIGLICLAMFMTARRGYRKITLLFISFCLISSIFALHIGIDYTLSRFQNIDSGSGSRVRFAQKTMDMFKDFRVTGAGVGNFRYIYQKYQSADDMKRFIRFAHNDWAQFLSEAGIVGMCLLLTGMFYYVFRTSKHRKRRSDPFAVNLGAAPFAVMAALAFHSYFDFNLHIPANALMLTAITAIGYSALHLDRRGGTSIRYFEMPLRSVKIIIFLPILALLVWTGIWTIRHFMAESYCNTFHDFGRVSRINTPIENIRSAISWDRANAAYWYELAQELMKIRNEAQGMGRLRDPDSFAPADDPKRSYSKKEQLEIMQALGGAIRLNPYRAVYYLRLGWECTFLWQEPDYTYKWLPAADRAMVAAAKLAGEFDISLHVELGRFFILRSKMHDLAPIWQKRYMRHACRFFKKALALESKHLKKKLKAEIIGFIEPYYPEMVNTIKNPSDGC